MNQLEKMIESAMNFACPSAVIVYYLNKTTRSCSHKVFSSPTFRTLLSTFIFVNTGEILDCHSLAFMGWISSLLAPSTSRKYGYQILFLQMRRNRIFIRQPLRMRCSGSPTRAMFCAVWGKREANGGRRQSSRSTW